MAMASNAQTLLDRPDGDDAMIQAGIRAFVTLAEAWDLKNMVAAGVLDVEPRTWTRMKGGTWTGRLTQDQTLRLSAVIGLYKGLHLYFSDALANRWVSMPNSGPPFMGLSPLDYVLNGGLPALMATRSYVDALRGGI